MTYDCLIFCNENDMLDLRLHTHAPFVDKFIIVEATETFTGIPKTLNYDIKRFAAWGDRIIYRAISLEGHNQSQGYWGREHHQRRHTQTVLAELGAHDDDIIFASDADELIDEHVFHYGASFLARHPVINVCQKAYAYRLNFRGTHSAGPKITRYSTYRNKDLSVPRGEDGFMIHGGWHFSYMFESPKDVLLKCRSFSHADEQHDVATPDEAVDKVLRGLVHHREEIDSTFPKYLVDNQWKFAHLIG